MADLTDKELLDISSKAVDYALEAEKWYNEITASSRMPIAARFEMAARMAEMWAGVARVFSFDGDVALPLKGVVGYNTYAAGD